jgi:1-acyl-sn-glycerol-3-phosphate acyltransferase
MIFLRSLIFNIYYVLGTIVIGLAGLPLLIISENTARIIPRAWSRCVLEGLKFICGTDYEIRGREHLTSQPVIFACKHQSAWDIAILLTLVRRPAFVLKRELLWMPISGWYMWRLDMIPINRSKGHTALKAMLKKARKALHARKPLIIYPEGTRTVPGAAPRYLPGVATLYGQLMVPVVPIALNSGSYWGRNAFIKKPGTIVIEFLPTIPPGLPPRDLQGRLQETIEAASAKLLKEADER